MTIISRSMFAFKCVYISLNFLFICKWKLVHDSYVAWNSDIATWGRTNADGEKDVLS